MDFIAAPPLEMPGVEGPTGLLLSPHAASALHELSPLRGERSADVLPPSRAQKHQIISPWEGNRQSPREDLATTSPTLRHSQASRANKQNDCGSREAADVKQRGNHIKPPRGAGLFAKEEYAPQDTDKGQHDTISFDDSHGEHSTRPSTAGSPCEPAVSAKEGGETVPLAEKVSGLMATGRKRSPAQKREGHQQQREAQQQHRARGEQTKMCEVDFKFTFDYAVRSEENTRQQLALISQQLGDEAVAQHRFLQQLKHNATGRKSYQRPETVSTRPTLGWKTTEQHDKGIEMSPLDVRRQPFSASTFGSGITAQLHMSQLGSPSDSMWIQFGRDLARMHELSAGRRYGFEEANFIGATPQLNEWHDDWIEFNQVCRFEPQIRQARDAGVLNADEAQRIGSTVASIGQFLPAHPHPAMLHGDLWSGNLMPLDDGVIAVIDPACSIGDGWADLAMMKLFGGIPSCCFDAYAEARVSDDSPEPERIVVYQLYHLINHVNLFGRGYLAQVMQIVESLG